MFNVSVVVGLTILFIALKLCEVISWNWFWVVSPIWMWIIFLFFIYLYVIYLIIKDRKKFKKYKKSS